MPRNVICNFSSSHLNVCGHSNFYTCSPFAWLFDTQTDNWESPVVCACHIYNEVFFNQSLRHPLNVATRVGYPSKCVFLCSWKMYKLKHKLNIIRMYYRLSLLKVYKFGVEKLGNEVPKKSIQTWICGEAHGF